MKTYILALAATAAVITPSAFAESAYIVRVPANVRMEVPSEPEAPQEPRIYESCLAYLNANPGAASGSYSLDPDGNGPIEVADYYCDMERHGGGWMLVVKAQQGSHAHVNVHAVGSLFFPDQNEAAKLPDALINAFSKTMYRVVTSTGSHSVFFDTSDTFSAIRLMQSKVSLTFDNPVWEGPFHDPHHLGFNTHQAGAGDFGRYDDIGLAYGGGNSCRFGIRVRAPGVAGDWCGPGDAATVWIR